MTTGSDIDELSALLRRSQELLNSLKGARESSEVADRLTNSVIRPLTAALNRMGIGEPPAAGDGSESLWDLAQDVTRLRLRPSMPAEVLEATAALQDLACRLSTDEERADRIARLRELQATLPASIQSQANGPYLVTNVER